jgi:hypothetical protein
MEATFSEVSKLSNDALTDLAKRCAKKKDTVLSRIVIEEEILRQLQKVARCILADVILAPDVYRIIFGEFHMVSRHLMDEITWDIYRKSEGRVSDETAKSLRYSIVAPEKVQQFIDYIIQVVESTAKAKAIEPYPAKKLLQIRLNLFTETYGLSDYDAINNLLRSYGSSFRYTGTELNESSAFQFILFIESHNPNSLFNKLKNPELLLDLERSFADLWLRDELQAKWGMSKEKYLAERAAELAKYHHMEIWCELMRSPLLAPDANGMNFIHSNGTRYIHVWSYPL